GCPVVGWITHPRWLLRPRVATLDTSNRKLLDDRVAMEMHLSELLWRTQARPGALPTVEQLADHLRLKPYPPLLPAHVRTTWGTQEGGAAPRQGGRLAAAPSRSPLSKGRRRLVAATQSQKGHPFALECVRKPHLFDKCRMSRCMAQRHIEELEGPCKVV